MADRRYYYFLHFCMCDSVRTLFCADQYAVNDLPVFFTRFGNRFDSNVLYDLNSMLIIISADVFTNCLGIAFFIISCPDKTLEYIIMTKCGKRLLFCLCLKQFIGELCCV